MLVGISVQQRRSISSTNRNLGTHWISGRSTGIFYASTFSHLLSLQKCYMYWKKLILLHVFFFLDLAYNKMLPRGFHLMTYFTREFYFSLSDRDNQWNAQRLVSKSQYVITFQKNKEKWNMLILVRHLLQNWQNPLLYNKVCVKFVQEAKGNVETKGVIHNRPQHTQL